MHCAITCRNGCLCGSELRLFWRPPPSGTESIRSRLSLVGLSHSLSELWRKSDILKVQVSTSHKSGEAALVKATGSPPSVVSPACAIILVSIDQAHAVLREEPSVWDRRLRLAARMIFRDFEVETVGHPQHGVIKPEQTLWEIGGDRIGPI